MTLSKRFVPNDPIFEAGGKLDSRPSRLTYRVHRFLAGDARSYFKTISEDPGARLAFGEFKQGWHTTLTLYGMKWVLDDVKKSIEHDLKLKTVVVTVD